MQKHKENNIRNDIVSCLRKLLENAQDDFDEKNNVRFYIIDNPFNENFRHRYQREKRVFEGHYTICYGSTTIGKIQLKPHKVFTPVIPNGKKQYFASKLLETIIATKYPKVRINYANNNCN